MIEIDDETAYVCTARKKMRIAELLEHRASRRSNRDFTDKIQNKVSSALEIRSVRGLPAREMLYSILFISPFFTPASGKTHIATTMKTAVTIM